MITQQELHQLLHYDPETGHMTWLQSRGRIAKGQRSGSIRGEGYRQVMIDGVAHQEHRLAWLWMTGEWPDGQIDHKDRVRSNNCWSNLRVATHAENQQNVGMRGDNTSGFRGVSKHRGKWQAHITRGGRRVRIGGFDTAAEANQAAISARQLAYGEFTNEIK